MWLQLSFSNIKIKNNNNKNNKWVGTNAWQTMTIKEYVELGIGIQFMF